MLHPCKVLALEWYLASRMIAVLISVLSILTVLYAILLVMYIIGWQKQKYHAIPNSFEPTTSISVVVPARNEENNIKICIDSILGQHYPSHLFEIIVVNDHSTDNTEAILKRYSAANFRYLNLSEHLHEPVTNAYKKKALSLGISKAKGELIVTTDADCIAKGNWLSAIASLYQSRNLNMIVAPVSFTDNGSLVEIFQSLDFMSLQGITLSSLQMKAGNMCNGANLAFTKSAYEQVDGYKGIDHLSSGDDYLLMMKINKEFPDSIAYLKSKDSIIKTPPQPTWAAFINQRIRWASKSGKYDDSKMTSILGMVYLYNLLLFIEGIWGIFNPIVLNTFLISVIIKTIFEVTFLYRVAKFYGKVKQMLYFPLFQPLHILYVVTAGLLGMVGVYQWKGRTVR